MKNETKKNYYNILEGKLQIFEAKEDEFLRNQWQDDINFAKEELHDNYLERIYYQNFVDKFLVNIIETIIEKLRDKTELDSKHCIRFELIKKGTNNPSDKKTYFDGVSFEVKIPTISSDIIKSEYSYRCFDNDFDEKFKKLNELSDKIYSHISTYTEVSNLNDTSSEPIKYSPCFHYTDTRVISFECTLKDLINMYYMEKQKQEYESYDARYDKKRLGKNK